MSRALGAVPVAILGVAIFANAAGCSTHAANANVEHEIGQPCELMNEYDPGFPGFEEREVVVQSSDSQCPSSQCVANHFRGRVSCPYGQDRAAKPLSGSEPCTIKGRGSVSVGVPAQCTDRRAADVVTCSCRCANADGKTDDGAVYCACPSGFSCAPLVSRAVQTDGGTDRVSGSYCIKAGTAYDPAKTCLPLMAP